jgi:cell division protein FtsB
MHNERLSRPLLTLRAAGAVSASLFALVLAFVAALSVDALAQMPDLSQMSGRSLPSPEMPVGTVSVRVIRGAITNNLPDQAVTIEGEGQPVTVKTDTSGRAIFSGLRAGSKWRAVVTVEGERLESQPFVVPSTGGLRVILAAGVGAGSGGAGGTGAGSSKPAAEAGAPAAGAPAAGAGGADANAAPVPGEVVLGSQSRLVIELAEASIEVYALLPLGNTKATPVMPAQPIVFEAPEGATSLTVLEGSTPQAKAKGRQVTVTGPFAPGETPLQIAYRVPYDGDTLTFSQALPLAVRQPTVVVRKIGNLRLEMPGVRSQREAHLQGRTYLVASADRVDANGHLDVRLRGLPHRAMWPRYLALLLALMITVAGVWIAVQPDRGAQDETDANALRTRRASLFEQLVTVERRLTSRAQSAAASAQAQSQSQSPSQKQDEALADLRAKREALIAEIEDLDDVLESVTSAARARTARERSGKVAADASKAAASIESRDEPRPAVR